MRHNFKNNTARSKSIKLKMLETKLYTGISLTLKKSISRNFPISANSVVALGSERPPNEILPQTPKSTIASVEDCEMLVFM